MIIITIIVVVVVYIALFNSKFSMVGVLKFTLEFYLPSKQHPDFKTASMKC